MMLDFKWRHFQEDIIIMPVRWYLSYSLSYRDIEELMLERFIEATKQEEKVLYYGFCFDGDDVHCREAYADGDGVLAHLDNVGSILNEALQISTITRFEMHGPEKELEKVKEALKDLNPKYMNLQYGFRRPY